MESSAHQDIPTWSTRQVVSATLLVAGILILFLLFYRFNNIVFIFLISIVLGMGIRPAVNWMGRRGISRSSGVIILYLMGFSLIAVLLIIALPLFVEQITEISKELPKYYGNFRNTLFHSSNGILSRIATQLPPEIRLFNPVAAEAEGTLDQAASPINYLGLLPRATFTLTAVLFLGFYWTLESDRSIRSLLLWLPANRREQAREFIVEVENKVGGFVFGQSILCLSIGVTAYIAYLLIGMPYALVLAIIAGIMEAVPVIGPTLGAIPALLVAFSFDPAKVIWVVVASLLIQGLENYLLVPHVMKRSVGVNQFVVLLTIAAFTSLFGLAGALLAIPIAAVFQLSIDRFMIHPVDSGNTPDGRGQVSVLRYEARELAQDLQKQLREYESIEASPDHIVDSLESIARDLDQLLVDTEQGSIVT